MDRSPARLTPRPVAPLALALAALLAFGISACGRGRAPAPGTAQTAPPSATGDAAARQLVARFMAARMGRDGQQARIYLSQVALGQYEEGAGGLALIGAAEPHYAGWEVVKSTAAAGGGYDLAVRIRQESERQPAGAAATRSFLETLTVGPGPDWRENPQPWILRAARRTPG